VSKSNKEIDLKKQLDEFVYIISHDFNAPLRQIREFSKLLIKNFGDKVTDKERRYVQFIENNTTHVDKMLSGLLELSRLSTTDINIEKILMNDVINNSIAKFQGNAKNSDVRFEVGDLPSVMGDAKQLQKMFDNLIDNALKFKVPDRNANIKVTGVVDSEGSYIHVSDNGCGIDASNTEKIFTLFKTLHFNANIGVGAGLAIVKKIADNHNCMVTVDSVVNEGTLVKIFFPNE
jgi:light-regulated signal transduction histidine kinase (bacteriophytochrome)